MKNTNIYKDFIHKSFFDDKPEIASEPPKNIIIDEHQLRYIHSQIEGAYKLLSRGEGNSDSTFTNIDNAGIELLKIFKQNNIDL